jgi:hypothetical protein
MLSVFLCKYETKPTNLKYADNTLNIYEIHLYQTLAEKDYETIYIIYKHVYGNRKYDLHQGRWLTKSFKWLKLLSIHIHVFNLHCLMGF